MPAVAHWAVPVRANVVILAAASTSSIVLLAGACNAQPLIARLSCAFLFSYTANTLFSLLHEAVHGILHPNVVLNEWGGRITAAFFPTSLAVQRAYHLTHHRNNRSALERFDYFQPGEIKWLKRAQWYAILTGLYWWISVAGLLVFLVTPGFQRFTALRKPDSRVASQTASRPYLDALDQVNPLTSRLEIILSIGIQCGVFLLVRGNLEGWVLCYSLFALRWSSLQYADHAYSPLDVHEGAWNLRVNRLTQCLFLNYHLHLNHHRHPAVPWVYLPRLSSESDPAPRYRDVWLSMWRGPRPLPGGS